MVQPDRPQMTIWHVHITCWIRKTKNTQLEYILLIALPMQQWLHERALILRSVYTACLVE
jgi:hypothetical protein